MKKVNFYAAELSFDLVKNLYNGTSSDQFAALIFQQEIIDVDNKNDEYVLIAYPVDNMGAITAGQHKIALTPDTSTNIEKKKKVNLANLPMSRAQIKYVIDNDPAGFIDHLYFKPKSYPIATKPNDPYVAYSVQPRTAAKAIAISGLTVDDLNPSPPATPPM